MKANLSHILLFLSLFCFHIILSQNNKNDSIITKDSITVDSIKKPKEVLGFIVTHNAEGYTIQNAKKQTVTLYDKAHVIYNDIDLKAGKIIVDYKNNLVNAKGIFQKDSITDKLNYVQRPVFKQGSQESEQDSIIFNFKTKKAIVYGVKTMQGEMLVYGEKTKRVNDSTIYIRNIKFTTSKKKNPDYYIATNKAKLVPGKKIIVGASNMVIADVPTPLYLPFAYFPLHKKRTSGFLIPSWGENYQQGLFLQNGGYYFVVNDYVDLELTGDIYSNGSWGANSRANYYVRYKYSGNLSLRYQNLINSIRGFNDYSKTKNFNISWRHSQDSKSSPNSRLSASVNIGTSKFFRQSMNEIDANQFLTNTFNSSINYYRKFIGTPFNMNVSLNHSQNSNTEDINMTLPSLQVNMDRQYPFQGKGGIKKNPIQKIGISYNMSGKYQINTNDDDFLTNKMWRGARAGIQHNLSANTNMKAFKYFTVSPNLSYKDVWYFDKIEKRYDNNLINDNGTKGKVVTDTISGFNRFNNYSGGASVSTTVYGMFNFKSKRLKAIRHTIRPSISWSYRPDFRDDYLEKIQQSADPTDILEYTQFDGGIYGAPSSGESNFVGISINNLLEAKVAPKEDEDSEENKKITLLNNLTFSSGYNIAADSLRWSNISMSAGTSLFKNKLGLNFSGSLNPYLVTTTGKRLDRFNSFPRLQTASLTANYSISSKDFSKEKDEKKKDDDVNNTDDVYRASIGKTSNDFAHQLDSDEDEPKEKTSLLYHSTIPWNISFAYSAGYSNNGYQDPKIGRQTLGFSGNVELSPKWKVGFSSGYDIKDGAFSYTRLNFSRDLDSFRFNFNWIPFGVRTSYYFFIGIKSSMLSDLKWDKNKPPDRRLY